MKSRIEQLITSPTNELYVDINRTDSYVPDGSVLKPFKGVTAIQDAIDALTTSASNPGTINIAPGTYLEQVTLKSFITLFAAPDTVIIQNDSAPAVIAPSSMGNFGCSLFNISSVNNGTGNATLIQTGGSVAFYGGTNQANDSEGCLVQGNGFVLAQQDCGFFSTQKSGCKLEDVSIGVFSGCVLSTGDPGSFYDLDAAVGTIVKMDATNDFMNRTINILGTKIYISYAADMFFDYSILTGTGSPEGSVVGSPGDLYLNKSGGANVTLWVKESGTATNTGWVGK